MIMIDATTPLSLRFDSKFAAKIEENLLASFAYRSRTRQAGLYRGEVIVQFSSKISQPSPYFNLVLQANFATPERAHHHIRRIQRKAQIRNVPLFWLVGPSTRPVNLGNFLEIYQFSQATRYSGMMTDFAGLNEQNGAPTDLIIEPVRTPKQLRQFVTLQAAGAPMSNADRQTWFEHEVSLGLDQGLPRQRYLGLWHGEPVAACATFSQAGVVGLDYLAVSPWASRYGVSMAIWLAALRQARRSGQRYGVSIVKAGEEDGFRQLGFRAATEFKLYCWSG